MFGSNISTPKLCTVCVFGMHLRLSRMCTSGCNHSTHYNWLDTCVYIRMQSLHAPHVPAFDAQVRRMPVRRVRQRYCHARVTDISRPGHFFTAHPYCSRMNRTLEQCRQTNSRSSRGCRAWGIANRIDKWNLSFAINRNWIFKNARNAGSDLKFRDAVSERCRSHT